MATYIYKLFPLKRDWIFVTLIMVTYFDYGVDIWDVIRGWDYIFTSGY